MPDSTFPATTIRCRRDEWMTAGFHTQLEQICMAAHHKMIGLDLQNLSMHGCILKAPRGGEAGRSPVDRRKQGTKRSRLVDGIGIPLRLRGCWREQTRLTPADPNT